MRLAITDANIFIDLIHIGFVEHLFNIGFEIHTCAEVLEELNERQQRILSGFGDHGLLKIDSVREGEHDEIAKIVVPKSLSATDVMVVFLAQKLEAVVLSGDSVLRKHCEAEKMEVHGILWLLDRFIDKGITAYSTSITQLEKLMSYNDRLPKNECDQRLRFWRSKTNPV